MVSMIVSQKLLSLIFIKKRTPSNLGWWEYFLHGWIQNVVSRFIYFFTLC